MSLADAIKKPIIPLLLEKVTWPPEGPMGMILTQLLYIDFCKPTVDIQNDWKCAQFNDLLKRIDPYFTKVPKNLLAWSDPIQMEMMVIDGTIWYDRGRNDWPTWSDYN